MSIYDYTPPTKEEAKPSVTETAKPEETKPEETQKTILIDGPLSEIYTKALDTVYSQRMSENVSQETQQTDSVVIAQAGKYLEAKDGEDNDNGVYVYVTDVDSLARNGISEALGNVRLALDMKNISTRALVLEHRGIKTSRVSILSNFAESNGMKVFHSRSDAIKYLKGI